MQNNRLLSLDVLRGITVAGMILVNAGYGDTYAPLKHSEWNGMTPCDLVFPFFLFIMGVSTYLSLSKFDFRLSGRVVRKILRRTALIFLIGLAINWLGSMVWDDGAFSHLRIMAVLQRIALCYGIVSFLVLLINHRYVVPVAMALLLGYAVILLAGNGYAQDDTNIAAIIDKAILGENHLYRYSPIDPEGLLGTLPAIAHTLLGFFCGRLIKEKHETADKVLALLLTGTMLVVGGYLLQYGLPLNKAVWSPSFVLMTCGLAALLLGLLMFIIDIRGKKGWTVPFLVFGVNPLFLYVLSELMAIFLSLGGIHEGVYVVIRSVVGDPYLASLGFALSRLIVCAAIGYILYRRHIFIKI